MHCVSVAFGSQRQCCVASVGSNASSRRSSGSERQRSARPCSKARRGGQRRLKSDFCNKIGHQPTSAKHERFALFCRKPLSCSRSRGTPWVQLRRVANLHKGALEDWRCEIADAGTPRVEAEKQDRGPAFVHSTPRAVNTGLLQFLTSSVGVPGRLAKQD